MVRLEQVEDVDGLGKQLRLHLRLGNVGPRASEGLLELRGGGENLGDDEHGFELHDVTPRLGRAAPLDLAFVPRSVLLDGDHVAQGRVQEVPARCDAGAVFVSAQAK